MWLNFSWVDSMFLYWPVVLIFITVLVMFFPARVSYHHSRKWWAFSNVRDSSLARGLESANHLQWRLLLAGLYPVEFRDFFLGDMYCSQTYAMGVSKCGPSPGRLDAHCVLEYRIVLLSLCHPLAKPASV